MSITVRTWSDEELKKVLSGEDAHLSTIFMNVKTFTKDEIKFYPYIFRKTYTVYLEDESYITVYAVDDESLKWFLSREYHIEQVVYAEEIITSSRMVDL